MNITNVNLAAKTVGNRAIEGEGFVPYEQSGTAEDFVSALKGQEQLRQEAKPKDEPAPSPQQDPEPVATAETGLASDATSGADNHQALVALLEEYFPLARKDTEVNVTVPDATAMLALSEDFNQAAEAQQQQDGSQNLTALTISPDNLNPNPDLAALSMASSGMAATKPAPTPETTRAAPASEDSTRPSPTVSLQKYGASAQAEALPSMPQNDNPKSAEGTAEGFKQALALVAGAESPVGDVKTELLTIPRPVEARAPEQLAIARPITHPDWDKDLGEHILWLNNKELSAAEIKLNPVNLGPISVRIDVGQDNQASIQFTAQHAETKEALEASMPKLREMLQGQQLNLVNVNISQHSGSQQGKPSPHPFQGTNSGQEPGYDKNPKALEAEDAQQIVSKGLLSLYA